MKILETLSISDESLPFDVVSYNAKNIFKIRSRRYAPTRFKLLKFKKHFKFKFI